MPEYGEDITLPKEVKWNLATVQAQYIQELRISFSDLLYRATANPTVANIAEASSVLKRLWMEVEMILHIKVSREVLLAFTEFGEFYALYSKPPMHRSVSNSYLQVECLRRIEEIYRKINIGLQDLKFFYQFKETESSLEERMKIIDSGIYDKRRKPKPAPKVQGMDDPGNAKAE